MRHVRRSHGLSQRELAQKLGVTHRCLSELESGMGKQANERYFAVLSASGSAQRSTMLDPLVVRLLVHVVSEMLTGRSFRWIPDGLERIPLNAPVLSHSLPPRGRSCRLCAVLRRAASPKGLASSGLPERGGGRIQRPILASRRGRRRCGWQRNGRGTLAPRPHSDRGGSIRSHPRPGVGVPLGIECRER